jgi:predicted deacylase
VITAVASLADIASVGPGERVSLRRSVTTDINGGSIDLVVHVVSGAAPGPTLLLTALTHGDEWQTIPMMRAIIDRIAEIPFDGRVVLIPVCSPPALENGTRATQPDSEGPDLNRVFPGRLNWIPDQIARVIAQEVLPHADAVIDYHHGIWGHGIGFVMYGADYSDPDVSHRCKSLALSYGHHLVWRREAVAMYPGSLITYAAQECSIPGIVVEIGVTGMGKDAASQAFDINVNGVVGVMRSLSMTDHPVTTPAAQHIFGTHHRVTPRNGGIVVPVHEPDEFGRPVAAGELLGTVMSPYSLETVEELRAPAAGMLTVFSSTRLVRPGAWSYAVGEIDETVRHE